MPIPTASRQEGYLSPVFPLGRPDFVVSGRLEAFNEVVRDLAAMAENSHTFELACLIVGSRLDSSSAWHVIRYSIGFP